MSWIKLVDSWFLQPKEVSYAPFDLTKLLFGDFWQITVQSAMKKIVYGNLM